MATRRINKTQHNGNGRGNGRGNGHGNGHGSANGRKIRMELDLKSSHTESIRTMIIREFVGPPLRLDRSDAEKVADKMVKIAEKSREVTDKMKLP